jgi:MFS family permease
MAQITTETTERSQIRERKQKEGDEDMLRSSHEVGEVYDVMDSPLTFRRLIAANTPFSLFLLSFILARLGGWLTYVASITLIEDIMHAQGQSSQSAVSTLVAIRFLPIVILSPLGGALADSYDRLKSMICLDVVGAVCPFLSIVALKMRSIALVYVVTLLQQSISGLYEPCRSSFTPLLVSSEDELKKATTLTGLSWSVFAAVGSSLGGVIVSSMGLRTCFGMSWCVF